LRSSAPPLLGSTTPRLFTPPLAAGPPGPCGCGCALTPATSLGFSAVEFATDVVGIRPLPWQRFLLIHALELVGGRFRYRTILILVARQNGKTTIIEVKNLWKLFVLGVPLVIGTAQNLDTAEESWDRAVEIIEGTDELAAELVTVNKVNGKKFLKLANGSRWKIAAASRRARGLSGNDVNLDELREHQNWRAWAAVTKTTMARIEAQIFAFSNAGDDASVVLNDLQGRGRSAAAHPDAADRSIGFFEYSAPDDTKCTCRRPKDEPHRPGCQLLDRSLWAMANPSLGYPDGVSEEALAAAVATDPDEVFLTECLCVRVESLTPEWRVISESAWTDRVDGQAQMQGRPAYGVHVPPDRSCAAIAAAGARVAGGRLIELTGRGELDDYRPGTKWVVPRLLELEKHEPSVLIIDDKALADEAEEAGLVVHRANVADVVTGCQLLYDGVAGEDLAGRDVWHLGQQAINDSVRGADKRKVGNSWAWERHALSTEVAPVAAASLALFGHSTPRVHRPSSRMPMAAFA